MHTNALCVDHAHALALHHPPFVTMSLTNVQPLCCVCWSPQNLHCSGTFIEGKKGECKRKTKNQSTAIA